MAEPTGNPNGRPTDYSKEKAEYVCEKIATSEKGLKTLHDEDPKNFPGVTTIFRWLDAHEDFRKLYARARECQAEYMRDSVLKIADDNSEDDLQMTNKAGEITGIRENKEWVNRSKLRCEVRLRMMAKLYPKVYGRDSEKIPEEKEPAVTIIVKKDRLPPVVNPNSSTENQDVAK